jgi:hypothetical protein
MSGPALDDQLLALWQREQTLLGWMGSTEQDVEDLRAGGAYVDPLLVRRAERWRAAYERAYSRFEALRSARPDWGPYGPDF